MIKLHVQTELESAYELWYSYMYKLNYKAPTNYDIATCTNRTGKSLRTMIYLHVQTELESAHELWYSYMYKLN